jgi:lactoylglutathione lyase
MNIRFGYTIIYVSSVEEALDFYKRAFGFETKMILDSKEWGELDTGDTTLAFAAHEMGRINLDDKYQKADINELPFGIELSFITDNVQAAFDKAVAAGAIPIREPSEKPWGQTVSYVRSMDGTVIEIATQVGG